MLSNKTYLAELINYVYPWFEAIELKDALLLVKPDGSNVVIRSLLDWQTERDQAEALGQNIYPEGQLRYCTLDKHLVAAR